MKVCKDSVIFSTQNDAKHYTNTVEHKLFRKRFSLFTFEKVSFQSIYDHLQNILVWYSDHGLKLNISKCNAIHISTRTY